MVAYRITNKMRKVLAAIAKSLPECHYKDRTERVKVGVADKRTIKVQNQPKPVNHKKQIEAAFERGGKVAVLQYVERVNAMKVTEAPEAVGKEVA